MRLVLKEAVNVDMSNNNNNLKKKPNDVRSLNPVYAQAVEDNEKYDNEYERVMKDVGTQARKAGMKTVNESADDSNEYVDFYNVASDFMFNHQYVTESKLDDIYDWFKSRFFAGDGFESINEAATATTEESDIDDMLKKNDERNQKFLSRPMDKKINKLDKDCGFVKDSKRRSREDLI